ncbi:DUF484 family protein [Rhodanobacter sp. MP7CTX1]|jgi:uncharacterized protein|uniref:DUF484 family protein n=1 Tax=Rhodanobacter sp. MP7CTX1 TaxID=2723084 RepID=UPI001620A951|nr:DUF484 family protein [Rhodanobacter sp. MP7CTX1]MBB6187791.1 hypothetical protein [Rhodanobacter sp. MP7CTX1]
MTATLLDDATQARVVAAYLKHHPEFLSEYPELAAKLTMPREQGPVSSLAIYQLHSLREKNAELERRLAELIEIAAENEQLMERVHALTVALLRANTMEVTARSVVAKLSADFHTEQVRLVLFGNEPLLPRADWLQQVAGPEALPEFADFLHQSEPVSGRLAADKLSRLFGPEATLVRSVAMMRLGDSGMLAIGSHDPDRFQPGMGTLFLKMISATITAALARSWDVY